MKHEWRKSEKPFYLPKKKPELVDIPAFNFFTITGSGDPNDDFFKEYIGVLYSLSYTIRMSPKKDLAPVGYYEYTIYPLEGVWDISEEAKAKDLKSFADLNKSDFVFNLMIRQPDFVTGEYAAKVIERVKKEKPHDLLDEVEFVSISEGQCIQMLHVGTYDSEPESFMKMEDYAQKNHLNRLSKKHREIYLSDPRKANPVNLKTVLRFQVH
ncbi:MAG TPA: GyrI-like domain-containing protein [Thermotogota bacterium]|nr:GyrI-like domain-containing protein [Thermotogota bacterium]HRW35054.1 GyrI-like domain-containing protein [Thermotogota bacterium]